MGGAESANWTALAAGAATILAIVAVRNWLPRVPDRLAGTLLVSIVVAALVLPVETIASQYGALPRSLPMRFPCRL